MYFFRFPNVTHLSVRATGLQHLGQLHALAELRGITGLNIMPEGNPICVKMWREYAVYRLAHWGLKEINDEPVFSVFLSFCLNKYVFTIRFNKNKYDSILEPLVNT